MTAGLTKDAGWEIGVSRALPQTPSAVWEFISGPRGLDLWLGAGARLTPERGAPYTTDSGEGEYASAIGRFVSAVRPSCGRL